MGHDLPRDLFEEILGTYKKFYTSGAVKSDEMLNKGVLTRLGGEGKTLDQKKWIEHFTRMAKLRNTKVPTTYRHIFDAIGQVTGSCTGSEFLISLQEKIRGFEVSNKSGLIPTDGATQEESAHGWESAEDWYNNWSGEWSTNDWGVPEEEWNDQAGIGGGSSCKGLEKKITPEELAIFEQLFETEHGHSTKHRLDIALPHWMSITGYREKTDTICQNPVFQSDQPVPIVDSQGRPKFQPKGRLNAQLQDFLYQWGFRSMIFWIDGGDTSVSHPIHFKIECHSKKEAMNYLHDSFLMELKKFVTAYKDTSGEAMKDYLKDYRIAKKKYQEGNPGMAKKKLGKEKSKIAPVKDPRFIDGIKAMYDEFGHDDGNYKIFSANFPHIQFTPPGKEQSSSSSSQKGTSDQSTADTKTKKAPLPKPLENDTRYHRMVFMVVHQFIFFTKIIPCLPKPKEETINLAPGIYVVEERMDTSGPSSKSKDVIEFRKMFTGHMHKKIKASSFATCTNEYGQPFFPMTCPSTRGSGGSLKAFLIKQFGWTAEEYQSLKRLDPEFVQIWENNHSVSIGNIVKNEVALRECGNREEGKTLKERCLMSIPEDKRSSHKDPLVICMRHAAVNPQRETIGDEGKRQVYASLSELRKLNIGFVVSSTKVRAFDTAALIADELKIPHACCSDFNEITKSRGISVVESQTSSIPRREIINGLRASDLIEILSCVPDGVSVLLVGHQKQLQSIGVHPGGSLKFCERRYGKLSYKKDRFFFSELQMSDVTDISMRIRFSLFDGKNKNAYTQEKFGVVEDQQLNLLTDMELHHLGQNRGIRKIWNASRPLATNVVRMKNSEGLLPRFKFMRFIKETKSFEAHDSSHVLRPLTGKVFKELPGHSSSGPRHYFKLGTATAVPLEILLPPLYNSSEKIEDENVWIPIDTLLHGFYSVLTHDRDVLYVRGVTKDEQFRWVEITTAEFEELSGSQVPGSLLQSIPIRDMRSFRPGAVKKPDNTAQLQLVLQQSSTPAERVAYYEGIGSEGSQKLRDLVNTTTTEKSFDDLKNAPRRVHSGRYFVPRMFESGTKDCPIIKGDYYIANQIHILKEIFTVPDLNFRKNLGGEASNKNHPLLPSPFKIKNPVLYRGGDAPVFLLLSNGIGLRFDMISQDRLRPLSKKVLMVNIASRSKGHRTLETGWHSGVLVEGEASKIIEKDSLDHLSLEFITLLENNSLVRVLKDQTVNFEQNDLSSFVAVAWVARRWLLGDIGTNLRQVCHEITIHKHEAPCISRTTEEFDRFRTEVGEELIVFFSSGDPLVEEINLAWSLPPVGFRPIFRKNTPQKCFVPILIALFEMAAQKRLQIENYFIHTADTSVIQSVEVSREEMTRIKNEDDGEDPEVTAALEANWGDHGENFNGTITLPPVKLPGATLRCFRIKGDEFHGLNQELHNSVVSKGVSLLDTDIPDAYEKWNVEGFIAVLRQRAAQSNVSYPSPKTDSEIDRVLTKVQEGIKDPQISDTDDALLEFRSGYERDRARQIGQVALTYTDEVYPSLTPNQVNIPARELITTDDSGKHFSLQDSATTVISESVARLGYNTRETNFLVKGIQKGLFTIPTENVSIEGLLYTSLKIPADPEGPFFTTKNDPPEVVPIQGMLNWGADFDVLCTAVQRVSEDLSLRTFLRSSANTKRFLSELTVSTREGFEDLYLKQRELLIERSKPTRRFTIVCEEQLQCKKRNTKWSVPQPKSCFNLYQEGEKQRGFLIDWVKNSVFTRETRGFIPNDREQVLELWRELDGVQIPDVDTIFCPCGMKDERCLAKLFLEERAGKYTHE